MAQPQHQRKRWSQGMRFSLLLTQSNNLSIVGGTRRWVDRWAGRKVEALQPWQKEQNDPQGVIIHHHSFIPIILIECLLLYTKHSLWVKDESTEELGGIAQNYIIIVGVFLPIFLQVSFFEYWCAIRSSLAKINLPFHTFPIFLALS